MLLCKVFRNSVMSLQSLSWPSSLSLSNPLGRKLGCYSTTWQSSAPTRNFLHLLQQHNALGCWSDPETVSIRSTALKHLLMASMYSVRSLSLLRKYSHSAGTSLQFPHKPLVLFVVVDHCFPLWSNRIEDCEAIRKAHMKVRQTTTESNWFYWLSIQISLIFLTLFSISTFEQSGKLFCTGFVLRHAPFYKKVKEIVSSGVLGKIISIEANETLPPPHGGYIMR